MNTQQQKWLTKNTIKGDRVFYKGSSIIGVKRDTMLVVMLGFLALLLLGIAGRQGGLTIITAMMNILIFVIGFWTADDTSEILSVCSRLILFFCSGNACWIKWNPQENFLPHY